MDPGTLFPSLDGLDPGTAPPAQDVTGFDLPPAKFGDQSNFDPASPAPKIEGSEPPPALPAEPAATAAAMVEPPAPRKGRSAAERIAQLTRRYHAEASARTAVEDQLARLTDIVENQNRQIAAMNQRPLLASQQRASATDDQFNLASGAAEGSPAPSFGAPNVTANDIAAVVTKAIETYDQRQRRERAELEQVREAQLASYQEAAEEIPDLGDARTRTHKLFMDLYNKSPIRHLPDAPYQIALQVRGIMADEAAARTDPVQLAARKQQASNIVPQPPMGDVPTNLNRAQVQKQFAEVSQRLKMGDTDSRTYVEWRNLREQLRRR